MLTTHYIEEAERLCDRVAIIDHGRILVCDTPAALTGDDGGERLIDLRVEHPRGPYDLPPTLARLPGVHAVDARDGGVRLRTQPGYDLVPDVVAVAAPYGVRDVTVAERSLETVFVGLTGRELRD